MFARGLVGREQEFLDSLHVMEVGMRHFFATAMHAKTNNGKPEIAAGRLARRDSPVCWSNGTS